MKWKNVEIGAAFYYVTGTFVEWRPLLKNADVRRIVAEEIAEALSECGGYLSAYVLMPDHVHLLVFLPERGPHVFNKLWRGRSARRIIDHALARGSTALLAVMAKHANGRSRYAVWKEQPRALAIWDRKKLHAMMDYIHANPVRRKLVGAPGDWEHSSWRFYERGEDTILEVRPPVL